MQKVEEVRVARQARFNEQRMAKSKGQQKEADRRQLEQEIHLVKAPGALAKEREQKLKGEQTASWLAGWLAGCYWRWMPVCLAALFGLRAVGCVRRRLGSVPLDRLGPGMDASGCMSVAQLTSCATFNSASAVLVAEEEQLERMQE
jgi:hypothetical protein